MYRLEIIVKKPHSIGTLEMDEAVGKPCFLCGGGPKDSVFGYRFPDKESAELAKDKVWCWLGNAAEFSLTFEGKGVD